MPPKTPYADWSRQLENFVYSRLGDRGLAEDIAQESLLRLMVRTWQGEPLRNPHSWVFRIAHNLCIDVVRRRLPSPIGSEALSGYPDPSSLEAPEEWLSTRCGERTHGELLERLPLAIEGLPLHYRAVLVGHYREGLTCDELAVRERISLDNVKVRLHRARKQLRSVIESRIRGDLVR